MSSIRALLSTVLATALALPTPVSAAQPADLSAMSDDEKLERAKALFGEGNAAVDLGDFSLAVTKFEEAYYTYAPNLHVFNYNIGNAAFELGDCVKAKQAFQRFLDLVPDHPERGSAQERLVEIESSNCAQPPAAVATTPVPTATPAAQPAASIDDIDDAPILSSRRSERQTKIEDERTKDASTHASGLLVAGGVLAGLGVAALAGGGVSLLLANRKAKDLADAASPGDIGFPEGNYADGEVYDLDRKGLPNNNLATLALFGGGGALLVTGITLMVVNVVRKKKNSDVASHQRPQLIGLGASVLPRGAAAAATVRF